jgi:hypothetical protein
VSMKRISRRRYCYLGCLFKGSYHFPLVFSRLRGFGVSRIQNMHGAIKARVAGIGKEAIRLSIANCPIWVIASARRGARLCPSIAIRLRRQAAASSYGLPVGA